METIHLDGAQGEGGGQVLRSALTLSMLTGTPFRIERIRAKRNKPGLLRQHLTAVTAATAICGAEVSGATLGSQTLSFHPGPLRGGDYRFAIGTAGSCTLVLQTVLPALWRADAPSVVQVSGGTHNPAAPPADFLIRTWQPLMQRMGVDMQLELLRHGFYPAGGGEVCARVTPVAALQGIDLATRGAHRATRVRAVVAGVPGEVAEREIERVRAQMDIDEREIRTLSSREGPGNALIIETEHAALTECFTAFGERGLPAETVADRAAKAARQYLAGTAAVGEHLADQLVLPMALAGGGCFTTAAASSHLQTNIGVIEKFLAVQFEVTACEAGVRVG